MTKELVITNLDSDLTVEELRNTLEYFGKIQSIKLLINMEMAFFRYENQEDAQLAIRSINGSDFLGNHVIVGWASDKKSSGYNLAS